jgi:peptidoglycan hydrolase-like protein with peptidoglycan-binding domain
MSSTRGSFAQAIVGGLGVAETQANSDVFVAVMAGENTKAAWNPCATEEAEPGDSDYNPDGVKNYPSEAEGVAATVATLRNGRYGAVLVNLGQGNEAVAAITAWAQGRWGTFDSVDEALTMLATVQANRGEYYGVEVTGPATPAPEPLPIPDNPEVNVNLPQLSLGSQGGAVEAVQVVLNGRFAASPPLAVDGVYGELTEATVKAFQGRHGLAVDGVAGPLTLGALYT